MKYTIPIAFILLCILGFGQLAEAVVGGGRDREVTVKVVGDNLFARQRNWQDVAKDYLDEASEGIADLIGVRLKIVEYELWRHDDTGNFTSLVTRMVTEIDHGDADIIIGFTLTPHSSRQSQTRKDGLTLAYRGFMVRTYQGAPDQNFYLPYMIIHEMLHVFGAVHVHDGSIMSPCFEKKVRMSLDPLNQEIISLTRNIDFKRGYRSLPREHQEKLARLYKRATQMGNHEVPTYMELGTVCRDLGHYQDAIDAFREVVRKDRSSAFAWDCIAECYRSLDQMDRAISTLETAVEKVAEKGIFYGKLAVWYFNSRQYEKSYDSAKNAEKYGVTVDPNLWKGLRQAGVAVNR